MPEMLVDSAKLDACLEAEADAIRAKTGGSSEIPFDFADRKGFADAIAAIPTGGEPEIVLPSGYTKLDYAESSGTQLINTGVAPAGNLEVCIDFVFLTGPYQSYPPPTGSRNPLFTIMASAGFTGSRYWAIGNKPDFTTIQESTLPSGNYAYQEQWSIRASLNAAEAKIVQPPFAVQTAAVPSGMTITPNENARIGIFGAYMFALALGFEPNQAAGIAIIGGADGPTAIFLSSKLSPNLMGAIAVCAYSYMALVPLIQPPLMRLLTTKKERVIKMKPAREVSQTERILFPIIGLLLTAFIVPSGLPLLGMLFFGNLLKESGKTTRLAKTAGAALNDIVVMLLGLTVGCSTQASEFLTINTIYIFMIGAGAFIIATMSGVCFVKIMNLFLPKDKKLNPLIGNAGVSAVPMAARISNNLGLEYDRHNFLLMHAMGPNVAGVIGSAVAAGALLGFLS